MLQQTARRRPAPRRPAANNGSAAGSVAPSLPTPSPSPSPDRFRIKLGKEAVKLALNGSWQRAAAVNRAILELHPQDSEAANRLAKALMELGDYADARAVLDDLCRRDPRNAIARKNLARLESLTAGATASVASPAPTGVAAAGAPALFIQDGGKSGTAILRPMAPAVALTDDDAPQAGGRPAIAVSPGDPAILAVADGDSDAIAGAAAVLVKAADGSILGALEPRLARRLRRLMAGGNRYSAAVVSIAGARISVVIRETHCDPALRNVVSFPAATRAPAIYADSDAGADAIADAAPESDGDADGDPETIAAALVSDDLGDDDADAAADSDDDAIPVLDDDAAGGDALPAFVPLAAGADGEDWE